MNWEEIYCQAERDYDFHKEELLMTTEDDQIDNSKWHSFIDTDVRYWSNAMLKQAMGDLIEEMNKRPGKDKSKGEIACDEFMSQAQEIADGMKSLKTNRSPF